MEGSDHRMLAVPELAGAVVVSVGLEPGGVPPSVLHFGGGPQRLSELLTHQIAVDERRGVFAPPRDAAWVVDEPGFDREREREIESLLAIGNGYLGSRGSLAEGTTASRPATFLAGAFEASADLSRVPELVILPDWGRLRFIIEGDPFSVETNEVFSHRRMLDTRRGLLLREGVVRGPGGHVTRLSTVHLASLADRHLLIEGVEVCPLNYSGTIRVEAILSGEVRSESGALHWAGFEAASAESGPLLVGRTHEGLAVALASHLEIERAAEGSALFHREAGETWASERCDLDVRLGEPRELYRTVALYSSRDLPDPRAAIERRRPELDAEPLARRIARHEAAWAERWSKADVSIEGGPKIERALRFALYHLISTVNPEDPRCSIAARSLSGEAYRGHVFWDVEIFMLPFFIHCYPEAARALLTYRHLTLPGARRKAEALGYRGALYAWESADTGDETTPAAVLSPRGEIIRILSGEQEHHISADVAYAVWQYGRCTGDAAFMRGPGLEILVETARFWASRVEEGTDGLFHIRQVIGPDEYHESVDDNAFTTWMARFNLRRAADAALAVAEGDPSRLGVTRGEADAWLRIADAMALGLDARTGLIEQFTGFHELERVELDARTPRHLPIDVTLGRERTQRSQVVKQADVVQLIALLWDEVAPDVRRRCFLHYEPLTAHGSSLSPGVHALVAARLGLAEQAERLLEQTADIDLGNTMGNAAGGVHAAALGALWQAVVLGIGGVRPAPGDPEALQIEPNLLPGIRHLKFPLTWQGRQLQVDIEPEALEVALEGEAPLTIVVATPGGGAVVRAEPGRRYGMRWNRAEPAWEDISP
ncbi:MAG: glycoside hydrolase family 65 protein [Polyangiaceae bacterium]|nr:glycoside hydrolase family 65 protein [Polyangiaceae bacterium]